MRRALSTILRWSENISGSCSMFTHDIIVLLLLRLIIISHIYHRVIGYGHHPVARVAAHIAKCPYLLHI